jgi:LacI family transcriptional regulator, gluconate utilization system Gnt-I transcriptional repressor
LGERQSKRSSVTVHDVARLAGVSAMTVSRVINSPDAVATDTVSKVQDAVAKLGYVRNRLAGGLRSSKSHFVAAVVPALSTAVYMETIEALSMTLARRGYHLMVGQTGYTAASEDEMLFDIISRRPDAIVLTGTMHSNEGRRRLLASGIPVVETWDLTEYPIDMLVGFSHDAIGAAVSEHFFASGRTRPAFIGADDARARRRCAAFERRSVELGMSRPPALLVPAPAKLGDGRHSLRRLVERGPKVDAIFCSSDMLASGVLLEARAQGVRVPYELAVVGFADLNFAQDLDPPLTTVRVDAGRIGQVTADIIVDRLAGKEPVSHVIDVGFTIITRSSG